MSFGQELNEPYFLISNEYEGLTYRMHELIFKNDSIVKEIFKLNCGNKTSEYNYEVKNDSLTIFKFRDNQNKAFKIESNELSNSEVKQIYLTYEKFENQDAFVVVVEGDIWNVEVHDSKRQREKEFRKFIKMRIKSKKRMEQIYLKGYDSYMKFGSVKGAIQYLNK